MSKDRLYEAVKYRLEEKAERNPTLLTKYLNDDLLVTVVAAAFTMRQYSHEHENYQKASEVVEYWMSYAMEQYIDDNYESELAEYRVEAAEAEAEARRDAMMDERAEREIRP